MISDNDVWTPSQQVVFEYKIKTRPLKKFWLPDWHVVNYFFYIIAYISSLLLCTMLDRNSCLVCEYTAVRGVFHFVVRTVSRVSSTINSAVDHRGTLGNAIKNRRPRGISNEKCGKSSLPCLCTVLVCHTVIFTCQWKMFWRRYDTTRTTERTISRAADVLDELDGSCSRLGRHLQKRTMTWKS